jgi:hypothetical protein
MSELCESWRSSAAAVTRSRSESSPRSPALANSAVAIRGAEDVSLWREHPVVERLREHRRGEKGHGPEGFRAARIPSKHKLRPCKGDPSGAKGPAAFKFFLDALPLEERRAQAPGDGHILEDAPLALDSESDDVLPHPLAIGPAELDKLTKPAGSLKEGVGQVERKSDWAKIQARLND